MVLVEQVPKAGVSGVTRWLNDGKKALIQLSLYGKTNDKFWFTFFHECCHILHHGKRSVFIEDGKDRENPEEIQADTFAGKTLIPDEVRVELKSLGRRPSKSTFLAIANRIAVHPGIVVGQWQHHTKSYAVANELKVKFEMK